MDSCNDSTSNGGTDPMTEEKSTPLFNGKLIKGKIIVPSSENYELGVIGIIYKNSNNEDKAPSFSTKIPLKDSLERGVIVYFKLSELDNNIIVENLSEIQPMENIDPPRISDIEALPYFFNMFDGFAHHDDSGAHRKGHIIKRSQDQITINDKVYKSYEVEFINLDGSKTEDNVYSELSLEVENSNLKYYEIDTIFFQGERYSIITSEDDSHDHPGH